MLYFCLLHMSHYVPTTSYCWHTGKRGDMYPWKTSMPEPTTCCNPGLPQCSAQPSVEAVKDTCRKVGSGVGEGETVRSNPKHPSLSLLPRVIHHAVHALGMIITIFSCLSSNSSFTVWVFWWPVSNPEPYCCLLPFLAIFTWFLLTAHSIVTCRSILGCTVISKLQLIGLMMGNFIFLGISQKTRHSSPHCKWRAKELQQGE